MADKKVVVMGGGIAGVTAARELATLGIATVVVEKSDFIGGHAAEYACKAAPECQKCNACEVEKVLKAFSEEGSVEILHRSTVSKVARTNGNFEVTIDRGAKFIDPAKCINCGLCFEACPAADHGAVTTSTSIHVHPRYAIDTAACLRLNGKDPACDACDKACPFGAIDLEAKPSPVTEKADAIVVATGFKAFDAKTKPQLGYGSHPDIITALDLEGALRADATLTRPSNGEPIKKVAFVQCVGSRDKDHPYCSKVCCGYALRMAEAIKNRHDDVEVKVFYIDFQPVGKDTDHYLDRYQQDLHLVRTMVGDIYALRNGKLRVTYQHPEERSLFDEEFDLAVLSVAIAPGEDSDSLAALLGLERDGCGFLTGAGSDDVVLAGTATGPMDVASSIADAKRAAMQVARKIGV